MKEKLYLISDASAIRNIVSRIHDSYLSGTISTKTFAITIEDGYFWGTTRVINEWGHGIVPNDIWIAINDAETNKKIL